MQDEPYHPNFLEIVRKATNSQETSVNTNANLNEHSKQSIDKTEISSTFGDLVSSQQRNTPKACLFQPPPLLNLDPFAKEAKKSMKSERNRPAPSPDTLIHKKNESFGVVKMLPL